jgi:hypothetical protein
MIKTLRITSVVAAILAAVLLVFVVRFFGVRNNEHVEEFLNSRGVKKKFESAADNKAKTSGNRVSPLVSQAEAFASYLNPQEPKTPSDTRRPDRRNIEDEMAVTPQFKVFGTTYYEGRPEMSQALIDEPGKGRHWVRQSSMVGRLLIEQIKDGLVVVRSSKETFKLMIEQGPETSFDKGASPVSAARGGQSSFRRTPLVSGRAASLASHRTSGAATKTAIRAPQPIRNAEENARAQELIDKLKEVQRSTRSGPGSEASNARIDELISKFKPTRVSPEAAKKLTNLGKNLKAMKDGQKDPDKSLRATDKEKVEASSSKSDGSAEK